jgi:hypothetical protein
LEHINTATLTSTSALVQRIKKDYPYFSFEMSYTSQARVCTHGLGACGTLPYLSYGIFSRKNTQGAKWTTAVSEGQPFHQVLGNA